LNLADAPFDLAKNPLSDLSRWEDIDREKHSIDWYAIFKESPFFYRPSRYFSPLFIEAPVSETVLIKYLNQAERVGDLAAVLDACRMKFEWDKRNCRNDTILAIWESAEKRMKEIPLLK
jgi:hypothetical protein